MKNLTGRLKRKILSRLSRANRAKPDPDLASPRTLVEPEGPHGKLLALFVCLILVGSAGLTSYRSCGMDAQHASKVSNRQSIDSSLTAASSTLIFQLDSAWNCLSGPCSSQSLYAPSPFEVSRVINLPEEWANAGSAILSADAKDWHVGLRVNGVDLGSDQGGPWTIKLDLKGNLRAGGNELVLRFEPKPWAGADGVSRITPIAGAANKQGRNGLIRLKADLKLELGSTQRIDSIDVSVIDGVLKATAMVEKAFGKKLSFKVVRDGYMVASLPSVTVYEDGPTSTSVKWSRDFWTPGGSENPQLQYLVAEFRDGGRRQVRFGARELQLSEGRLQINGAPTYFAVQRLLPSDGSDRAAVADFSRRVAEAGVNAGELCGTACSNEVLSAADELGLPLMVTPHCTDSDKRSSRDEGQDNWSKFEELSRRRIGESHRNHPSVILWNLEKELSATYPNLISNIRSSGNQLVVDVGGHSIELVQYERLRLANRVPTYISGFKWKESDLRATPIEGLLEPIVRQHSQWGLGIALPVPQVQDKRAKLYRKNLSRILREARVPSHKIGPRRGPAIVVATVSENGVPIEGEPVLLNLPGQPPFSAFSDAEGNARIIAYFSGKAIVSTLDGGVERTVSVRPGWYQDGQWLPRLTPVDLDLSLSNDER